MSRHPVTLLTRLCTQKPVSTMCFGVAAAAFLAALAGAVFNSLLTEVMAVLGMTIVGLFYLGLGLSYYATREWGPLRNEPPALKLAELQRHHSAPSREHRAGNESGRQEELVGSR